MKGWGLWWESRGVGGNILEAIDKNRGKGPSRIDKIRCILGNKNPIKISDS